MPIGWEFLPVGRVGLRARDPVAVVAAFDQHLNGIFTTTLAIRRAMEERSRALLSGVRERTEQSNRTNRAGGMNAAR